LEIFFFFFFFFFFKDIIKFNQSCYSNEFFCYVWVFKKNIKNITFVDFCSSKIRLEIKDFRFNETFLLSLEKTENILNILFINHSAPLSDINQDYS